MALLVSGGPHAICGEQSGPAAPPLPRSNYVERVTSELVLIETYVTDGSGRVVKGLTKDDFVLEIGGLRRPISSVEFREVESAPPASGPGTDRGQAPPAPAAPAWPRRFILFFEDNTSSPLGLGEARKAAARFLESGLAPSDQIALASFDQRLRLLHDFTTDRGELRKAIDASIRDSARFSNFEQEHAEHLREIMTNPNPRLLQTLCEMEEARLAGAVKAAETLVDSLAGWRGYKAIVFMGDGIPESPMEDVWKTFYTAGLRRPASAPPLFESICTLADEIKDLSRAASAAGVTIDAISTRGLTAGVASAGKQDFQSASALQTLALNTAGVFSTTNDFVAAFHQIDEASRAFYVLAYVPEEAADGRYHHVIVRCRKPGLHLRFRRGFTRLPPAEARTRAVEAAYQFPGMFAGPGLRLETAGGPGEGNERIVDLILHAPLDSILFLPQAGSAVAHLTVGFVSIDDARRKTFETSRSVSLRRTEGEVNITGVDIYCRVRLPRLGQTVTAVLSDEQSGEVGGARARFDGASDPGNTILGLALYSLAERSVWIEVPAAADAAAAELSDTTIGPALKQVFHPGEPIVAGFRFAPANASAPVTFRFEIRRGGDLVRTRTVEVGPDDLLRPVKVPLPAEGLASGEYVLSIQAIRADGTIDGATKTLGIADTEPVPSP
jgi:VWFA-related protein